MQYNAQLYENNKHVWKKNKLDEHTEKRNFLNGERISAFTLCSCCQSYFMVQSILTQLPNIFL